MFFSSCKGAMLLNFGDSGYDISFFRPFCNTNDQFFFECFGFNAQCFTPPEVGIECGITLRDCLDDQMLCQAEDKCIPLSFACDGYPDCTDSSDETRSTCIREYTMRLLYNLR